MSWWQGFTDRVSAERLQAAPSPADFLLEHGLTAEEVLEAQALHHGCPYLRLATYRVEDEALGLLTEEQMRRYRALPLFRLDDRLYVAVTDPQNLKTVDAVANLTSLGVEPVVVLSNDLEAAFNRLFLTQERSTQEILRLAQLDQAAPTEVRRTEFFEDKDAPVIKLVERLLAQAIHLGASDIHLEPFPGTAMLRYRIDGRLHEFPAPPLAMLTAIVARIKIASNMDIAERRLPQDGRTTVNVDGVDYDLRVSIIPNVNGEGVVIRVLRSSAVNVDLTRLGFSPQLLERYDRLIRHPYGILLVTGPTGSGKSTTLYSTLQRIYSPEKKIITLEDPVEYQLHGVTQIQVNAEIGYTFAQGLRAILRHDPDIVLLGEIRDLESAEIAIRASLTGHQLFSTLHTNNAILAITRLVDMGVAHYQVMSSLVGVLAQRLIRALCSKCKRPTVVGPQLGPLLGLPESTEVFEPTGCPECNQLGYKGRLGIHELLEITPAMRALGDKLTNEALAELAAKSGFESLRSAAVAKLQAGLTSCDEVLALTVEA